MDDSPSAPLGDDSPETPQSPDSLDSDAAPPDAPEEWYYAKHGRSHGPVSEDELRALAHEGHIAAGDFVYAQYLGDWVRADSIYGLFEEVPGEARRVDVAAAPAPQGVPGEQKVEVRHAGFASRLAALFVDCMVLLIPTCCLNMVARVAMTPLYLLVIRSDMNNSSDQPLMMLAVFVISTGVSIFVPIPVVWLYFAFMESSRWQATLGKRALGIVVVDREGRRLSFLRATARYFASLISYASLFAGFIMGAFTKNGQTLHDMIADTRVVYGRTQSGRPR